MVAGRHSDYRRRQRLGRLSSLALGAAVLGISQIPFDDVSEQLTHGHELLDRARMQMAKGDALTFLGAMNGEKEQLQSALHAYSDALKEMRRDRFPLEWARAQGHLGNTLFTLWRLEAKTSRLCDAVSAHASSWHQLSSSGHSGAGRAADLLMLDLMEVHRAGLDATLPFCVEDLDLLALYRATRLSAD